MAYHRVLDALARQGCPICLLRDEVVQRYLDSLLYERVNDVGLRQRLLGSRGFCPEHAWALVRSGDSLATAILYKDQIAKALQDVQRAARPVRAGRPRGLGGVPDTPCPACEISDEAQARYVSMLVRHLHDPEMRAAAERSVFLCLPHLTDALAATRSVEQARTLLDLTETKLTHLHAELAELIRKRDYRFRQEPRGEEQTSWFRAVGQMVGWRRAAVPKPGDGEHR